jgi:hypothetical protein
VRAVLLGHSILITRLALIGACAAAPEISVTGAPSAAANSTSGSLCVEFGNSVMTARGGMYWCQGASPDRLSDRLVRCGAPAQPAWRIDVAGDVATGVAAAWIPLGDNRPGVADPRADLAGATHVGLRLIGDFDGRSLRLEWMTSADPRARGQLLATVAADAVDPENWRELVFPIADAPKRPAYLRAVFTGSGRGWVALHACELLHGPAMSPAGPPGTETAPVMRRALWVWKTRELLADASRLEQLEGLIQRQGVTDLYVQIPYVYREGVCHLEDAAGLGNLNARVAGAGATVHALDGKADYVLAEHHPRMFALVDALAAFNREADRPERYQAVHLDNEPYILPQWRDLEKRKAIIADYLTLNQRLGPRVRASGMQFGLDIPHWFDVLNPSGAPLRPDVSGNGPHTLLHELMPLVDNVGVMSYRERVTGPNGVVACCLTEFALGARHGVEVLAAVELGTGPNVEKGITLGCYSPAYAFGQIATLQTALRGMKGCAGFAIHYAEPLRELESRL